MDSHFIRFSILKSLRCSRVMGRMRFLSNLTDHVDDEHRGLCVDTNLWQTCRGLPEYKVKIKLLRNTALNTTPLFFNLFVQFETVMHAHFLPVFYRVFSN